MEGEKRESTEEPKEGGSEGTSGTESEKKKTLNE